MPQEDWWVEGVVRDHLAREDAPVFYVENALINALFGLLCWRAIFSAIPGAFFHPFHRGPADLFSADFFQRRERAVRAPAWRSSTTDAYRATILRHLRGQARHPVALRGLGSAQRGTARPGARLHPGRAPEATGSSASCPTSRPTAPAFPT